MHNELQTFLERPTAQNYRCVRRIILSETGSSTDLPDFSALAQLCQQGRFEQVRDHIDALLPAWSLSPRVHFYATWAARELDDHEDAHLETFLYETCLQGMLATGNGSRQRPYLITHQADQYDLLAARKLEPCSQTLVETGSLRFDVITCQDGTDIWFDVTDLVGEVGNQTGKGLLSKTV